MYLLEDIRKKKFEFRSTNHQFSLNIADLSQNKKKQDVWKFNLIIDEEDVTKEYFGNNNNLNFHLDYYQFISDNSDFVFIPTEGSSLLINTKTLEKKDVPFVEESAELFLSNSWIKDYHITVYNHCIYITNLKSGESFPLVFDDSIIIYASFSDDEHIMVEHYSRTTKATTTHIYNVANLIMTKL